MSISISVLFIPFDAAVQHKTRNATRGVEGQRVVPGPSMPLRYGDTTNPVRTERVPVEPKGVPMTNAEHAPFSTIVSDACKQAVYARLATSVHPYLGTPAYNDKSAELFKQRMQRRLPSRCPHLIFLSEEPKGVPFEDAVIVTLDGVGVTYQRIGVAGSLPVQRIAAYSRSGQAGQWHAQWETKTYQGSTENILVASYVFGNESFKIAAVHLTAKNTAATPGTPKHDRILSELRQFCQTHGISAAIGDFNADVRDYGGGTVGALPDSTKFRNRVQCATCGAAEWSNGACKQCNGELARAHNEPEWIEQYSNSVNTAHYMGLVTFGTGVALQEWQALSLQRSLDGAYFSDHPPIYADIQFGAD